MNSDIPIPANTTIPMNNVQFPEVNVLKRLEKGEPVPGPNKMSLINA